MTQRIVIDPVTRIEGHAKISLYLDDAGEISDARFHITEFRGFERFCEGRLFWEMPGLTSRVCGICPVSHLLASAKAGDQILGVAVPPAGEKLRQLMNMAQIIQSHALSFFHLSSPDLLLGFEAPVAERNIIGVAAAQPDVARAGIRVRQFGQEIIKLLGGRKIHPAWSVPGGVREPLRPEERDQIRAGVPEQIHAVQRTLRLYRDVLSGFEEEVRTFGVFPSMFMSLVGPDGEWEHYSGKLRIVDAQGRVVEDGIEPASYREYFGERSEPDSYVKSPYYLPLGYPEGMYRVGPLARLNVCESMGTPLADEELARFREYGRGAVLGSFHYHEARLIEILACLERISVLIEDPDLLSPHCRAEAGVNRLEGVGVSEAPRGTLFHHYRVDPSGVVLWVNLLIATGQNNLAMNRTVQQIARNYVRSGHLNDGVLNRIEAGIRAYDPCLSCSTHAVGQMPMIVELYAADGTLVETARRSH
jgi:NAD-reducing hydrogenase large subunit